MEINYQPNLNYYSNNSNDIDQQQETNNNNKNNCKKKKNNNENMMMIKKRTESITSIDSRIHSHSTSVDQTDSIYKSFGLAQLQQQQPMYNTTTTTKLTSPTSGYRMIQHMTLAGSFLDFALFVADVEHLKFLLDSGKDNVKYYVLLMVLLITSLALQV